MISIVHFRTPEEKAKGLQDRKIPPSTLFVFTDVRSGTQFHMRNVREPIDIAFLSPRGEVLECVTLVPPKGTITAPPGTMIAIEAKEGELLRLGFEVGRVKKMEHFLERPKPKAEPEPEAKKEEVQEEVETREKEAEEAT